MFGFLQVSRTTIVRRNNINVDWGVGYTDDRCRHRLLIDIDHYIIVRADLLFSSMKFGCRWMKEELRDDLIMLAALEHHRRFTIATLGQRKEKEIILRQGSSLLNPELPSDTEIAPTVRSPRRGMTMTSCSTVNGRKSSLSPRVSLTGQL